MEFIANGKPDSANTFLQPFVNETISLLENGLEFYGKVLPLMIEGFICDAPAKSFIKYTKGHNGYSSCGSCKIVGEYEENRVVFCGIDFEKRTDTEYRQVQDDLSDDTHKLGIPILERLPIDMITQFPHDYMHLIC